MHSHLKTFAGTLAALDRPSKVIARKLAVVNAYKNILPKVSLARRYPTAQRSAKAAQSRGAAAGTGAELAATGTRNLF